ncbi:helix-turn-helix transcriptional regulator [Actinocrispum sp. NPDC049592]|uniref:response regulator transcription factor n=1 Tax=Actinocrispum sp. NPDC049592 TaxID=3154835 RepID=UPI00342C2C67
MEPFQDRRYGPGRRRDDRRTAAILRTLEQDLGTMANLVGATRTDLTLSPEVAERLEMLDREVTRLADLARHATMPRPDANEIADARHLAAHLTDREWECLGLLVQGLNTTAMSTTLGISPTTARTHIQSLLTKLGVHSRLEAVALTLRTSLLDNNFS